MFNRLFPFFVHGRNGYVQRMQRQKKVNQIYLFCVLHIVLWCFTFVRNFIIISQTVFNLQSRHKYMVEMAVHGRDSYVQCSKGNNSKKGKPDLWFINAACHLIVLYIYVKFLEKNNIVTSLRLKMLQECFKSEFSSKKKKKNRSFLTRWKISLFTTLMSLSENQNLPIGDQETITGMILDGIIVMERTQMMEVLMDGRKDRLSNKLGLCGYFWYR